MTIVYNDINLKSLEPKIAILPKIKLVAKCITMSFSKDQTDTLWRAFRPQIKNIPHKIDNDTYSVQIYPDSNFFEQFSPLNAFKKYAAVKVSDYDDLPSDLEKLIIPKGQYAIFDYIGKPSEAPATFRYILTDWLTHSQYKLDNRPHFAKMGEKYTGEYADSEEELMIPISLKS